MTILLIPHIWVISCRTNGQMVLLSTWSIFTHSNIISVSGKMAGWATAVSSRW